MQQVVHCLVALLGQGAEQPHLCTAGRVSRQSKPVEYASRPLTRKIGAGTAKIEHGSPPSLLVLTWLIVGLTATTVPVHEQIQTTAADEEQSELNRDKPASVFDPHIFHHGSEFPIFQASERARPPPSSWTRYVFRTLRHVILRNQPDG